MALTSEYTSKLRPQRIREKSAYERSFFSLNDASSMSTITSISSAFEKDILHKFLYSELASIDCENETKLNVQKVATRSTATFPRVNLLPNSFYHVIKQERSDSDKFDHLRTFSLQKNGKTSLFGRSSNAVPAWSTLSTTSSKSSSGSDDDILNQFLYSEMMKMKRDRQLFCMPFHAHSYSVLSGISDLTKIAEAHSTMLEQLLNRNNSKNILREADISETLLVEKKGAIYIAGCKLDFPESSFQTALNVKLSCYYPLQATYDDGIIVSPEIQIECQENLMKRYCITMPTCYFSTDDSDPAQITTQFCDGDDNWKTIDAEARFSNTDKLNVVFKSDKIGRFRCVVRENKCPKLSKNMVSTCFLRRCKNSDHLGIVWYLVDDWQHLESRVRLEMSPETVYQQVFFVNIPDVKYGTEIHLQINGETVVIANETLWESLVYEKRKFDFKSLKKTKFSITNNQNKLIFDHVEQWGVQDHSDSMTGPSAKRTPSSRKLRESRNRYSSRTIEADASSFVFMTAMTSTLPKSSHSEQGIKSKFLKLLKFRRKKK